MPSSLESRVAALAAASPESQYRIEDLPALFQRLDLANLETKTGGSPALQDARRRLRELSARLAAAQN